MNRFFILITLLFSALCSNFASASEFDPKNYVYNDEGSPLFVKVYIEIPKISYRETSVEAFDLQKKIKPFFNLMQNDDRGSFIVIPIKTAKDRDEDDYWECPLCGTENPATRNTCTNPDCPLYRKKGRDW